jgi:hypothetical protein
VLKSSNIRLLTRAGSVFEILVALRFASFQRVLDEFCHAGQGSGRHFVGAVPIEMKKLRRSASRHALLGIEAARRNVGSFDGFLRTAIDRCTSYSPCENQLQIMTSFCRAGT